MKAQNQQPMILKNQYLKSAWSLSLLSFIFNYVIGFGQCLTPFNFSSDGTFESLSGVASSDGYNSNIYAGGWSRDPFSPSTPDSWVSPMPIIGSGLWSGLADGMPSSPDGGVFVGGWVNENNSGEALVTRITGLEAGKTYVLKFYQANAGIEGRTPVGITQKARWRVTFNTQTIYSTAMDYKGEGNQIWMEEEMTFTATATSQDLTFRVDNDFTGFRFEYMVVDGVRLFHYEDTDGDGIANCQDLDDDNDGILDEVECPPIEILSMQNTDGTFESLSGMASSDVYNSNISATGWSRSSSSPSTPDSWISPMPSIGSGLWAGLADGMPSSPDGGVFIGGWVYSSNIGEGLTTRITGLEIGKTYVLKFYQANAGIDGITPISMVQRARWRVTFNTQIFYSTAIDYKGEGNQIWMEEEMTFMATATSQNLTFRVDNDFTVFNFEYMALDGVRLFHYEDTDGDGIMDYLDTDSDGDNCPDALEGSGIFTRNNLDANNRLAGAVDTTPSSSTYGVPLAAVTGQGVGSSKDNTLRLGCPTTIITNRGTTFRVKRN